MNEKIIRLEETLAHQTVEINRLSDELYLQQKELVILQARLEYLIKKLTLLEEQQITGGLETNKEPPPPHY